MSSKKLKKNKTYWGIEPEYFPFKIGVARLSDEDLKCTKLLTPTERLKWLLMMQRLLLIHFRSKRRR